MDLRFISNPFPNNNDGFDYSPKSVQDINTEYAQKVEQKQGLEQFASMLASILK